MAPKRVIIKTLYFNTLKSSYIKDVNRNIDLIELDCNAKILCTLNVSNNPKLALLFFGENELEVLDVRYNHDLKKIFCYDNYLTEIRFSRIQISKIDFWGITEMKISGHTKIKTEYLRYFSLHLESKGSRFFI